MEKSEVLQDLSVAKQELSALTLKCEDLLHQNEVSMRERDGMSQSLRELKDEVASHKATLDLDSAERSTLESKIRALEDEKESAKCILDAMQERVDRAAGEKDKLMDTIKAIEEKLHEESSARVDDEHKRSLEHQESIAELARLKKENENLRDEVRQMKMGNSSPTSVSKLAFGQTTLHTAATGVRRHQKKMAHPYHH